MRKTYRLFGVPVWIVEIRLDAEDFPDEEEEETGESDGTVIISSLTSTPTEPPPVFGFVHDRDYYE